MITIENIVYYDVKEVADQLGRSPQAIRRFIRSGQLKSSKVGRSYYISQADIKAYIDRDRK